MIQVLRPNVSGPEAIRAFQKPGLASFYWRATRGPLVRIADAYVPFALFRVRYRLGQALHRRLFAMDAVDGSLDVFEFPKPPAGDELLSIETRNRMEPALDAGRAQALLRPKVLRVVFQQGFFKLRDLQLEIERESPDFHLPYWLGFYGTAGAVHCRVLDAVRRRIEGAKASEFFEQWLAA